MSEHVLGNIFMRTCIEPMMKGQEVVGHAHNFDHVTFVNAGKFRIEKLIPTAWDENNYPKDFAVERAVEKAAHEWKNWILIEAGVYHRLTALDDNSRYVCVYSHRRPDTGEVVEEDTGWAKAVN